MTITTVILNWNRPEDTLQAVRSILAQDCPGSSVVVWDNASTDDSRERLAAALGHEPRVKLVFADDNYGVAGGRNRAFRETDSDLLLSLDSDAWFEDPTALSRIVRAFKTTPSLGAASFEVLRPDGHLMWPFSRPAEAWRTRAFPTMRVDGCSFATRRELFERIGGFPEHYSPYGAEDQYYAYAVIGEGYEVLYMPEVGVIHAFAETGRNRRQFAMHVRNCLWIPLELFPFPQVVAGTAGRLAALARDAREGGQWAGYLDGVWAALTGFRFRRRKPMGRAAWKTIRARVSEDKALAMDPARR